MQRQYQPASLLAGHSVKEQKQQNHTVSSLPYDRPQNFSPRHILQLQQTIGNMAVQRMLKINQTSQSNTIQRVERSQLETGTWVTFPDMTVLPPKDTEDHEWIEPGTTAVVLDVPESGDIKIKIKSGAFDGKIRTISPSSLDLDPKGADKNLTRNRNDAIQIVDDNSALFGTSAGEIKASIHNPEKIDQAQFNFCGPNDFLMAIAMRDPISYVNYLKDLYTAKKELDDSGRATMTTKTAQLGNMSVNLDKNVIGQDPSNFSSTAPTDISKTDWMSMGSIRTDTTAKATPSMDPFVLEIVNEFQTKTVEDALKKAAGNSDALQQAIMVIKQGLIGRGHDIPTLAQVPTSGQAAIDVLRKIGEGAMPYEVVDWFTQYGATNIDSNADPFSPNKDDSSLADANSKLDISSGKMVMVNIDSDVLNDKHYSISYNPTHSHWVLLKTPLVKVSDPKGDYWQCQVNSWGAERTMKIADAKIAESYFGHVAATIATPY